MILVVIPSRGRPDRARDTVQAIRDTAALVTTEVIVVVDNDDPTLDDYVRLFRADAFNAARHRFRPLVTLVGLADRDTGNLVKATNTVSLRIAREDPDCIIGNLGDDHITRTEGWDRLVTEALREPGIAYGDDLLQGEALPTAPFISAQIVLALGYYFLPDLDHMYVDNQVRDIGAQTGTLRYLPEMVIEHMHPFSGKAEWDDGYRRVNAETPVRLDRLRYESWREHAMEVDVGRVRHALAVPA